MRLNTHTDYGLRLLMLGAEVRPGTISIKRVASEQQISSNHLMKVAQGLTKAGYLEPVRGRNGGFRLAKPIEEVGVGEVIRLLESELGLVECMRSRGSTCPLLPECRLPRVFMEATAAFFQVLDGCTLADLVPGNQHFIRLSEAR